jgi:hypothetical protein
VNNAGHAITITRRTVPIAGVSTSWLSKRRKRAMPGCDICGKVNAELGMPFEHCDACHDRVRLLESELKAAEKSMLDAHNDYTNEMRKSRNLESEIDRLKKLTIDQHETIKGVTKSLKSWFDCNMLNLGFNMRKQIESILEALRDADNL